MLEEFFIPVSSSICQKIESLSEECLGSHITIFKDELNFPDLENVKIAVFDIQESRGNQHNLGAAIGADQVRSELYCLYVGPWQEKMVDLGTILAGDQLSDTYFAVQTVVTALVKRNIIPVMVGGTIDLVYANYKAYSQLDQLVNLTVLSPHFGIGKIDVPLSATSYLSHIVLDQPNILFNYINIGYQTYYNAQSEISLIEQMNFEAYRLGNLKNNTGFVEPMLRDSDLVALNIAAVKVADAPGFELANPNGITGEEFCAIARYAGISDKVSSFGVYEFNKMFDKNGQTARLLSQAIWYFIEGVNARSNDYPYTSKEDYIKYTAMVEEETYVFFESPKSGRWWMQISLPTLTKYERHTLLSCSKDDYLNAVEGVLPDRWYKVQTRII